MSKSWAICLCFCLVCNILFGQDSIYTIVENDTLEYELVLVYDSEGYPEYYYRDVFTPVCKTGECLPVSIILYWDLIGSYKGFEVPEDSPLTKEDHKPFDQEDYEKLDRIFKNQNSLLADFDLEELKKSGGESVAEIDGVTGATPKNIMNSSISGAFYTCYTLWHLVYDHTPGAIENLNSGLLDSNLLMKLYRSENFDYKRYSLGKILSREDEDLIKFIVKDIPESDRFLVKMIVNDIPDEYLLHKEIFDSFLNDFESLDYSTKHRLLLRINRLSMTPTYDGIGKIGSQQNEELALLILLEISKYPEVIKNKEYLSFLHTSKGPITDRILSSIKENTSSKQVLDAIKKLN